MATSIDELLGYARRIYVGGEKCEEIAREIGVTTRWVVLNIRKAYPRLISEENWGVVDVSKHLGGKDIPLEMRKEVRKYYKKHGFSKTHQVTGITESSLARWSKGQYGNHCLEMGSLPWQSLFAGEDSGTRHLNAKSDDALRRETVYRMLTGRPDLPALATKHKIGTSTFYSWRIEFVGKVEDQSYAKRCEEFINEVATELGEDPKPLIFRRAHQTEKKSTLRRQQFSLSFKRSAVNRLENHGEPIDELAASLGISEAPLYAWRRVILGRRSDPSFAAKARALARDFVEEAQVDDLVEQSAPPLPTPALVPAVIAPQAAESIDVIETMAKSPTAIMESITAIERQIEGLKRDLLLLKQQLEIQKLRRDLAQVGGGRPS